jgi:hypothetical protein
MKRFREGARTNALAQRRRGPIQSHKLCSNPTNFGPFYPMNCESESRNYARSVNAER